MARPRTKGEVIALRLPLEVHNRAVAAAADLGISVGEMIGEIVAEALDPDDVVKGPVARTTCPHPGSELVHLPQGMRRCGRCWAVKGRDGVWRMRDRDHAGVWLSETEGEAAGDTR